MSFSFRARAQLILAVTSGLAGCNKQPAAVTPEDASSSASTPSASEAPMANAAPSVTPVGSASASASASAPPVASAPPPPVRKGLVCTDNAKLEHRCVTPRTPPITGQKGAMQDDAYSNYDANGCYPASAMIGMCSGVRQAVGPVKSGGQCCYDVCTVPVPCGRPMMVDGSARLATVTSRSDWSASALSIVAHGSVRERAVDAWLYDARMEHASVAAFSRLSLQLMSVGAPSVLVEMAHRAAIEEVEHARTCFAIASSLSGGSASLGPGPLLLEGLSLESDLRRLALETARESCVGETVAALSLSRAAEACTQVALKTTLRVMAEQELSHAALGFRILAWALPMLTESAREEALGALRVPAHDLPVHGDEDARAWRDVGRLTRDDLRAVEREARDVIAAAVESLRGKTHVPERGLAYAHSRERLR